jgi:quercetin dioxygenase-like cupin family protein
MPEQRATIKPYTMGPGEGPTYLFHGVPFIFKASTAETRGALAMWEATTRPGEEPQPHVHEEDEFFYLLSGTMTFVCGAETFTVSDGGFVFLPRGLPHTYQIETPEVRLLGFSTPSTFGDHVQRVGERVQ